MNINKSFQSPNFDPKAINVEFVVIHYTACSLESTLSIFNDKERKVSSHIILTETGEIYETVKCWENEVCKAWHAGVSQFNDGEKNWESFNDFSIGIEIINLNGNIFEYTKKQYESLISIINHFKSKYPSLNNPQRIIGHEQIAKERGKVDPGWLFDWKRIYDSCYPGVKHPVREPNLPVDIKDSAVQLAKRSSRDESSEAQFWQTLNSTMESSSKLSNK